MATQKKPQRKGLRLFWRIYFYGLGLLATVAFTAALATHILRGWDEVPGMKGPTKPLAGMLAAQLQRGPENHQVLQQLLQDIFDVSQVSITIYDESGACVAKAGSFFPPPLADEDVARLDRHKLFSIEHRLHLAVPLTQNGQRLGYALMSWHRPAALLQHLFILIAVFIVLALMPFLLARAISKPLARISTTARAIGTGDLSARTGLFRGDEIGAVARSVDEMAQRLAHLVHSEKELLANVSHEIRTPLARIRVLLELLEEERGGEEAIRSHVTSLGEDVVELERLLDDVLLTARLDLSAKTPKGSGFMIRYEEVNLNDLIAHVADRFSHRYDTYELSVDVPNRLDTIYGDPSLLRRVLENLLDNAAKYSHPDQPIELSVTQSRDETLIEVRDSGLGIPEEDLPRIFEPFFRTDRSRSRKIRGIGLGLTLCRRIVEAHHGAICARSRKSGGTVLSVTLPSGESA